MDENKKSEGIESNEERLNADAYEPEAPADNAAGEMSVPCNSDSKSELNAESDITDSDISEAADSNTDILQTEDSELSAEKTEPDENIEDEFKDIKTEPEQKPKKKTVFYTSIITAASILLAALIVFGVYKIFFTSSVEGVWALSEELEYAEENDSAVSYLVFEKDGVAKCVIGTYSYYGPYFVETSDGASTLSVSIPYVLSGEFDITIDGNAFSTRELTISSGDDSLLFVEAPMEDAGLTPSADFTADEEVIGKWYSEAQGVTYTLNSDGTIAFDMQYEDMGIHIDGIYTVNDGTITFTYFTDSEVSSEAEFYINDDSNLVIEDVEYISVSE